MQWLNCVQPFSLSSFHCLVNNNYPLRGSKFSPFDGTYSESQTPSHVPFFCILIARADCVPFNLIFDHPDLFFTLGGTRAVQFMSGGWIDNEFPAGMRETKSDTYIFPQDIAPTLLGMAEGSVGVEALLGGRTGATYGNAMWDYIKSSVDPNAMGEKQKVRKVSYSKDFFFDVKTDRTMKSVYTGDTPQLTPRLWEPIWPKEGDLLMYVHCFHYPVLADTFLTFFFIPGIRTTRA